jgi:thiaminase/transcriptional activator TenA
MTLSARFLAENAPVFEAMVGHRFVADIAADALPKAVFDRYLAYEGAFVETAVRIFAFAAAKAPDIDDQRHLVAVLDALANGQVGYFEATLAARGIDPGASGLSHPAVAAFRDGMLAIARGGSYLDIVTAMFAAEWMYWTWSAATAPARISDPDLRAWVDLHAADDFAAQARWLRARLDAAGDVGEAEAARLSRLFGHVLELEIAFHAAAYG